MTWGMTLEEGRMEEEVTQSVYEVVYVVVVG